MRRRMPSALALAAIVLIALAATTASTSGAGETDKPRPQRPVIRSTLASSRSGGGNVQTITSAKRYSGFFPTDLRNNERDVPAGIAVAANGLMVVAGTATRMPRNAATYINNLLVMAFNPVGDLVWKVLYPADPLQSSWSYEAKAVIATTDGGFLILGTGGDVSYDATMTMPVLLKVGPMGAVEWVNSYNLKTVISGVAGGVAELADGRFVVACSGYGAHSVFWIFVVGPSGNLVSSQCLSTPEGHSDIGAKAVCASTDGGFVVAGTSNSGPAELLKFNSSAALVWHKSFTDQAIGGHELSCLATGVAPAQDGGYLLVGESQYFGSPYFQSHGWALKSDGSGNVVWQDKFDYWEDYADLFPTADGGFLHCGPYLDKLDAQGQSPWSRVSLPIWLIAARPCPGPAYILTGLVSDDGGLTYKIDVYLANDKAMVKSPCNALRSATLIIHSGSLQTLTPTPLRSVKNTVEQIARSYTPHDRPHAIEVICAPNVTGFHFGSQIK